MSDFISFYSKAVERVNSRQPKSNDNIAAPSQGKIIRCRYCLSEARIHEPSATVLCKKCGNLFTIAPGTTYSIDLDSVKNMSGKQLYDAAFYNGKASLGILELSAEKKHIDALLLIADYWEKKCEKNKAETYYKTASKLGDEGKAAYVLYQFRQNPPFSQYPDLLDTLQECLRYPFYVVDPNICQDIYDKREKLYLEYCKNERRKEQEIEAKKDEYVDDDFYQNYYLQYINGQKKDDGADWNGMPWGVNCNIDPSCWD